MRMSLLNLEKLELNASIKDKDRKHKMNLGLSEGEVLFSHSLTKSFYCLFPYSM